MYQSQGYYHHNLGTAGHRVPSSYGYMAHYTPANYYHHGRGGSVYAAQMPQAPYAPQVPQQHMNNFYPVQDQASVSGGVTSVSDYDLNNMSTFLSWCSFGMLKQSRNPSKEFENLIVSVLYATRLPKSTIIIALEYMNQRFSSTPFEYLEESEIFLKLIVALILGNKFNDDNTFTNKSWSGATGLSCALLNKEEKEWLNEMNWQLNVVKFEVNIKTLEECWKTWLKKYSQKIMPVTPTTPYGDSFNYSYSSIPSSPLSSSPSRYPRDSIWSQRSIAPTDYWGYTPTYQYIPGHNMMASDPAVQYIGSSNFVGYTNPFYGYNMASC